MSDETPPPSLRLRPRARPEDAPPPAGVPVPPVAAEPSNLNPAPAAVEPPPRLRLKPKLTGEPAAAGPVDEPVAIPAPEVVAAPPPPVPLVAAVEPAESEPPSRLRLRPKLATESAVAADSSVMPAPESKDVPLKHVEPPELNHQPRQSSASPGGVLAPVPFTEPLPAEQASLPKEMSAPPLVPEAAANVETPVAPLPAFHLVAAPGATEATFAQHSPQADIPVPAPVRASAFCPRRIALVFIALILVVVGYYGYRALFAAKPAAPVDVAPPAIASVPAKPLTAQAVGEMPAKLITKAQDTVIAKRASEQSRIDPLAEGREPVAVTVATAPPAVVPKPPVPPEPPEPTVTASLPKPPKVKEPPPPTPIASLAFRAWVDSAKITGVLEGATPRAIINGRLARPGEPMDPTLGIVFARVDIGRRQIIFSDHSGAMVGKSY